MRRNITPLSPILLCVLLLTGCSSLGLSFQTGHPLTKQAKEVLRRSPRGEHLARELQLDVLPDHYLQPGDELLIETIDFESDLRLPADQRVMADGRVDLGRFGRVSVAGLTLEMAEELVVKAIAKQADRETPINIRLLEPAHRFYVLGEVNSPGSYPMRGVETVLDAILAAGGLTSGAAHCEILLARPTPPPSCRVTLPVCYREITQLGDTTTNYQIRPGDRIFVPSRSCLDELRFWESGKTCDRCCRCQSPCAAPEVFEFRNSFEQVATLRNGVSTTADTSTMSVSPTETKPTLSDSPPSAELAPPAAQPDGKSLDDKAQPDRLPATLDGELDFQAEPGFEELKLPPFAPQDSPKTSETGSASPPTIGGSLFPGRVGGKQSPSRFTPLWVSPPKLGS